MAKRNIKIKPGKNQSKLGFVVGLMFVCIGLFIVIPTFGLFGIFWTAMAVFICFANYKNGFTDNGMATHEIIIDDEENPEIFTADGFKSGILNSSSGREYVFEESDTMKENTYFQEAKEENEDIEKKLIKLNSLYEQKLITKEEYDEKRKQLLKEF